MTNAALSNFPAVHRIKLMQGSSERPGRAVVDCANDDSFTALPRTTTLTIEAEGFTGTWANMRVVKVPRARGGYLRVVLEDSRWVLREKTLDRNYNERDCGGNVLTGQQKTIQELMDIIAAEAGITVVYGTLPTYNPPAYWVGRTCEEALRDLLHDSGCRLVYQPEAGSYRLSLAGTGATPTSDNQVYQPAPPNPFNEVKVYSAPKLYEERISAKAVTVNASTGELVDVSAGTNLPDAPDGTNAQTLFRLWAPVTADADKLFVPSRVLTHLFGPVEGAHEAGRVIMDAWDKYPHHQPLGPGPGKIVDMLSFSQGAAFLTEEPMLAASGSNLATTATILTGYYLRNGTNGLDREESVQEVNGTASDTFEILVPWIRPIDSGETDVPADVWAALLEDVAQALASKYSQPPATVTYPAPINLGGSGQVGCTEYELRLSPKYFRMNFRVALNFDPGSEGEIR